MRAIGVPAAALIASVVAGCRDSTAPPDARRAELLGIRAPADAARDSGFRIVAYYGRGACERSLPIVERAPLGARVGMRVQEVAVPRGGACIGILLGDSVVLDVQPPVALPYLVRFERQRGPDTAVVVRARP